MFHQPVNIFSRAYESGQFFPKTVAHKLKVNVSLSKPLPASRWCFWRSSVTAVSRNLREQSSIAIKNTSFRALHRFWRQSDPSEVHSYNSYIHLYNSLSTLLILPAFPPLFSLETKLLCCCVHATLCYLKLCFILDSIIYSQLFKLC